MNTKSSTAIVVAKPSAGNAQTFNFNGTINVRVVIISGIPYFVAVDVAKELGYYVPKDAVSTHCRRAVKYRLSDNQGVPHYYNVIPECDVYRLIFRSNLPAAEQFQDWVYAEVLPAIRKTGKYSTQPQPQQASITESDYRQLEMLYRMEKGLREVLQESNDYYQELTNRQAEQLIERSNQLIKRTDQYIKAISRKM